MAIKVFPSANVVGGAGQKVLSEGNLAGWMMPGARNYVVAGLEMRDASSISKAKVTISAGTAVINGYHVVVDAPIDLTISDPVASTKYAVYLCLARDSLGNATGAVASCFASGKPSDPCLFLGNVFCSRVIGKWCCTPSGLSPVTAPWLSLGDTLRFGSVYYATFFESADGFRSTGSVMVNEKHIALTTEATGGASATLRKSLPYRMHLDCGRPYAIRIGIGFWQESAVTGYAGIGTPVSKQFIGVAYRDACYYGCHGDGTDLVETAQLSASANGALVASHEIIITVAGGKAVWQAARSAEERSDKIEATTNLPTGLGGDAILYAEVRTTEAVAKSLALSHWEVAQIA